MESDDLMDWGRLFQRVGARMAKARSPFVNKLERGMDRRLRFDERSGREVE